MAMTLTEKILARKSGRKRVEPGEIVMADLDLVLANDVSGALAIPEIEKMGYSSVFDPEKVVFVLDHFVPNSDLNAAAQCKSCRDFAQAVGLKHFYDAGKMGIEHVLLPELGLVRPGELIVGGDSHTCTYGAFGAFSTGVGSTDLAAAIATGRLWFKVPPSIRFYYEGKLGSYVRGKDIILHTIATIGVDGAMYKAMEFCGPVIDQLGLDDRLTICNMAIEAGAKNGIIAADEKVMAYLAKKGLKGVSGITGDPDAKYEAEYRFDLSSLEPQVAKPHLPSNAVGVSEVAGITLDQVVIGSCTNGRLSDLQEAASVMRGKKVSPNLRAIIIPGSQEVYMQAMRLGYLETFVEAGAAVLTPTCGPCFGGHSGVLAAGERCLSTTNRNFVGRMGDSTSEVYLSGPAVAAASAIKGYICAPWEV